MIVDDARQSPPTRKAVRRVVESALSDAPSRLIVEPGDCAYPDVLLAEVVAILMISERLDVEVAYTPSYATPATRRYGLPHGQAAVDLARDGDAHALPLIRDDAATVLVGSARHLGADGAKLHGESYVDDARLFTGSVRGVRIEPTREAPGVRARVERTLRQGSWHVGRAAQTGGSNLVVEREGVLTERTVKRSTFYRHHIDWKLVCHS
ncbi:MULTISPECIES: hypothetical protein [unclassified Gordonia (in: high G+C Gram-positive bacteria)]|uniref:hypothetical protein n=1 Tax=unclassified Gordonia (in: high G+C Gram-positive bacteria) TaxID=2657482 RepID=UPI000B23C39C|nr:MULTISPECIES: hypothetical protein [unclassified Gordonia (in: high G+C Gram-positive bacteria)]